MQHLATFEEYGGGAGQPAPSRAPSRPAPTTVPRTKPEKAPSKPSPIRRDKPSVDPAPKAKLKTTKDIANRFISGKDEYVDIDLDKIYKNK